MKKATINGINLHKAAKSRRAPPHPPQMLMKPQSQASRPVNVSGALGLGVLGGGSTVYPVKVC